MSPRRSAPGEILFQWVQVFSRLTPASNNNLDERWEFLWGGAHCRGTEWSGGGGGGGGSGVKPLVNVTEGVCQREDFVM